MLACRLLRKTQSTSGDIEAIEEPDVKFKGISSRPSFKNAIHQSLASQTQNTTAVIYTVQEYYDPIPYVDCPTCALIAEGSSMAYHDNSCPQCGEDTSHLTDSLTGYV